MIVGVIVAGRFHIDDGLVFHVPSIVTSYASDEEGHEQNNDKLKAENHKVGYDNNIDAVRLDLGDDRVGAAFVRACFAALGGVGLVENKIVGAVVAAADENVRENTHGVTFGGHFVRRRAVRVEIVDGVVEQAAELVLDVA